VVAITKGGENAYRGDEKRNLDDYLQEGWLGVMPPTDWALQTATESRPDSRVGGGDRHATPAGWMDALADTDTTGAYPSRFDPATLAFPPVDAPVWTVATKSAGDITDGTLDTVTPVVDEAALPADATTRLPADSMRSLFTTSAPINSYPALGLFGVLPTLHPSQHPTAGPTPTLMDNYALSSIVCHTRGVGRVTVDCSVSHLTQESACEVINLGLF